MLGFARFFPKYDCFFNNTRYLMTAKKKMNNKTSNYGIYMS